MASRTATTVVLFILTTAAAAGGTYVALRHGAPLLNRALDRDARWTEYTCHGTRDVSEFVGTERIFHATQAVSERVFIDAQSIGLLRNDGVRSVVTDFTRTEDMAEWRVEEHPGGDPAHRHTVFTVGNLFFRNETLMIRDVETSQSGEWEYRRSSLLSGTCHVSRAGRY